MDKTNIISDIIFNTIQIFVPPRPKLSHFYILFAFCQMWPHHICKHIPILVQQMGPPSARKEGNLPVAADLKCMCAHTHNPPLGTRTCVSHLCVTSAKITSEGVEAQINTVKWRNWVHGILECMGFKVHVSLSLSLSLCVCVYLYSIYLSMYVRMSVILSISVFIVLPVSMYVP